MHRFLLLDGLRGIAALVVMSMHLWWSVYPETLFGHFYLAVDFFFMLSGFVVAYAYEDRLSSELMTLGSFVRTRLIRLYPLIFLGGSLAWLIHVAGLFLGRDTVSALTAEDLALLASALFVVPVSFTGTSWPINGPSWSLFFELLANLAWAIAIFRMKTVYLSIFVAASAIGLAASGIIQGNISGGVPNVPNGIPRISYAFFAGVLLFRIYSLPIASRIPAIPAPILALALIAVLIPGSGLVHRPGTLQFELYGWSTDLLASFIVFPLTILIGANTKITDLNLSRICGFGGLVSYPLYITHEPMLTVSKRMIIAIFGNIDPTIYMLIAGSAAVMFAVAADRLYDRPIRKWLQARLPSHRPNPLPSPPAPQR